MVEYILGRDEDYFTIGDMQKHSFEINLDGTRDGTIEEEGLSKDATFDDYYEKMLENTGDERGVKAFFGITFSGKCGSKGSKGSEQPSEGTEINTEQVTPEDNDIKADL